MGAIDSSQGSGEEAPRCRKTGAMGEEEMIRAILDSVLPLPYRQEIRNALRTSPHLARTRKNFPALEHVDLPRRPVVIDVGAHAGYFSECVFAYRPHAKILAFEPLSGPCEEMRRRLSGYDATIESVALGRATRTAELDVRRFAEASSFLTNGRVIRDGVYDLDFSTEEVVSVSMVTLDDYRPCFDRIDLIKLDVQGYEIEVLEGAAATIKRAVWVYAEAAFQELYVGAPLVDDLYRWMTAHNFELVEMTAFKADSGGHLLEADMLFRNAPRPTSSSRYQTRRSLR